MKICLSQRNKDNLYYNIAFTSLSKMYKMMVILRNTYIDRKRWIQKVVTIFNLIYEHASLSDQYSKFHFRGYIIRYVLKFSFYIDVISEKHNVYCVYLIQIMNILNTAIPILIHFLALKFSFNSNWSIVSYLYMSDNHSTKCDLINDVILFLTVLDILLKIYVILTLCTLLECMLV